MQTLAQAKGRGCRSNARPFEELERHQTTQGPANLNLSLLPPGVRTIQSVLAQVLNEKAEEYPKGAERHAQSL
ncbi:MAG: hypothetical protein Q8M07_18580 [Prosthecobacter sp.]|nr:hypothetical protein [Prosthecobacter sp.]